MNRHVYIDLFSGCGGLSLGFYNSKKWIGLFALEKNRDAFSTLATNLIERNKHFDWPDWLPQKELDVNVVLKNEKSHLQNLRGKVDLIAGGPPCQGFSTAGKRIENDERNQLVDSYIDFVKTVQPKLIFFENVKGFTNKFSKNKKSGKTYSDYVLKRLEEQDGNFEGYNTEAQLINFSEYGVPQSRTRFILIGIRKDISSKLKLSASDIFSIIETNRSSFLNSKKLDANCNVEDALSDLLKQHGESDTPERSSFKFGVYNRALTKYQKYIRKNCTYRFPDSHRFANHKKSTIEKFEYILYNNEKNKPVPDAVRKLFNTKKNWMVPLAPDSPSRTITTLPDDILHYSEPRILTVRENARLQSFNDWYVFKGKYTTGNKQRKTDVPRYSQVGNAIPPLFAEQVSLAMNQILTKVDTAIGKTK